MDGDEKQFQSISYAKDFTMLEHEVPFKIPGSHFVFSSNMIYGTTMLRHLGHTKAVLTGQEMRHQPQGEEKSQMESPGAQL